MKTIAESIAESVNEGKNSVWVAVKASGYGKYDKDCEYLAISEELKEVSFWSEEDIENDEDLYLSEDEIHSILALKPGEVFPTKDGAFVRIKA